MRIQLSVTVRLGRKNAAQNPISIQSRPGRFVRAISHAISTASGSEISCRTTVTLSVLSSAARSPGSAKAARQPSSPQRAGSPGAATCKLCSVTRKIG